MKELSREKLIEFYNLVYPRSLEKDDDVKSNDAEDMLNDGDSIIIEKISDLKNISDWMYKNGVWSN